jgi:hypothetical protein
MPKFLTRRSAVALAIGFGVILLIALTKFGTEGATISAKRIGPLEIGQATRQEVQDWAKGPITFWFTPKGNPPVRFEGQLWQYECIGQSTIYGATCRTLYGLRNGHLATVETNSPQFHTAAGTRPGTSLETVIKSERGKWSGWKTKCPYVTLSSPKGINFLALISRNTAVPKGFVSNLYLSATPSSFSHCAS